MKIHCSQCHKLIEKFPSVIKRTVNHFCNKICNGLWQTNNWINEKNPCWKGGRRIGGRYWIMKIGEKYVLEHRYLMEKHLGRKLKKFEQVHHKNHNRLDNRIENLEIIQFADHIFHHAKLQAKKGKTPFEKRNKVILDLYKKGYKIRSIARLSDIPRTTVKRRLNKILHLVTTLN